MQATTRLKPQYLRALLHIAAKQDIRWYLNGVCLEMGAQDTLYIACDGHKLAVIRDEREKQPPQAPATLIVPREVVQVLPKPKARGLIVDVELRYDDAAPRESEARLGNTCFKPLDGKFPDWRKVIPKEPATGQRATYNPEYMMAFKQCVAAAFSAPDSCPELYQNGDKAGIVLVANHPEFVGLIMPRREESGGRIPDWAQPPKVEEPAPLAVAA